MFDLQSMKLFSFLSRAKKLCLCRQQSRSIIRGSILLVFRSHDGALSFSPVVPVPRVGVEEGGGGEVGGHHSHHSHSLSLLILIIFSFPPDRSNLPVVAVPRVGEIRGGEERGQEGGVEGGVGGGGGGGG